MLFNNTHLLTIHRLLAIYNAEAGLLASSLR